MFVTRRATGGSGPLARRCTCGSTRKKSTTSTTPRMTRFARPWSGGRTSPFRNGSGSSAGWCWPASVATSGVMLCNNCVITSITWCITCSTPYYMHYMLCYMLITCSILLLHALLHTKYMFITCSTILLHAALHAPLHAAPFDYMLYYLQHHSIT